MVVRAGPPVGSIGDGHGIVAAPRSLTALTPPLIPT
jgi:hypothetical protein